MRSARALKCQPPGPVAARRQHHDQRILQRGREEDTLQPFRPHEAARKNGVTVAGDFLTGFVPRNFPPAPRRERRHRQFRGLEGHGHAVAGDGWNHCDRVAHAKLGADGGLLRQQRKTGDGAKRIFGELRTGKPPTQW